MRSVLSEGLYITSSATGARFALDSTPFVVIRGAFESSTKKISTPASSSQLRAIEASEAESND